MQLLRLGDGGIEQVHVQDSAVRQGVDQSVSADVGDAQQPPHVDRQHGLIAPQSRSQAHKRIVQRHL